MQIAIAAFTRIQRRDGTITGHDCEGGFLYTVTKEGGRKEFDEDSEPDYKTFSLVALADEEEEIVRVPGAPSPGSHGPNDDDVQHVELVNGDAGKT